MFSNLHIVTIQLMLRFLMKDRPNTSIFLATEPYTEITPDKKGQILLEMYDNANHFGENKTIERIKNKYYWKGIYKGVVDYIKTCKTCQQNIVTRVPPREAIIPDTPDNPNDKITLEIIGPLPIMKRGNQFILSTQEQLTKNLLHEFSLARLNNQDKNYHSLSRQKLINHYIYIFSSPKHI